MAYLLHFADTYYRPSWHGGDVQRPLCHRGRLGICVAAVVEDPRRVTCDRCRKRLGLVAPKRAPEPAAMPFGSPQAKGIRVTRTDIAYAVAVSRGLTVADLKSPGRARKFSWPRQEAMARMIDAGFTTTAAGAYFGRDHTTAIAAKRAIARRLEAAR